MSDDEGDRLLIDDHDMSSGAMAGSIDDGLNKTSQSLNDVDMKSEETGQNVDSPQIYPLPILATNSDLKESVSTIDQGKQLENAPISKIDESREEGEIIDDLDPISIANIITSLPVNKNNTSEERANNYEKQEKRTQLAEKSSNSSASNQLSVDTANSKEKPSPSLPIKNSPTPSKSSPNKTKISPDEKNNTNGIRHTSPHQKNKHHSSGSNHHEKKKVKEEPHEDRKRSSSVLRPNDHHSSKKSKKDVGTSVRTVATNGDSEESLFDQPPGAQGLLNYTVVCKTDSNAIYISVRFKDEEYFGVISDGQPMSFAYKKRSMMNGNQSRGREGEEKETSRDKENGGSTPSKNRNSLAPGTPRDIKRTNRGSSAPVEKKRSIVGIKAEEKDEEEGDSSDGTSRSDQYTMLSEVPPLEEQHKCGVNGCEHRYSRAHELDYHKAHAHPTEKIQVDTKGSQTDSYPLIDKGVGPLTSQRMDAEVQTDGQIGPIICGMTDSEQQRSISLLMSKARRDTVDTIPATTSEDRHSAYSDISDDGAPTLNKETTPNRASSAQGGRNSALAGGTANSAFTPTEAGLRNEEAATSVLQSASATSFPVANAAPSAHSTAFHPVIDTTGKARPSSVASNHSQPLTASPRPAVPIAPSPNAYLPFVMMNGSFPSVPSSSSPVRPNNDGAQHKIHELKSKTIAPNTDTPLPIQSGATSSLTSGAKGSSGQASSRSVPSPARTGGPAVPSMMTMMSQQAAPMQQQMQQMQQMAAAQQMHNYMMMLGGRGAPFAQDPNLAQQLAAMQAASMFGQQGGPHMFPK